MTDQATPTWHAHGVRELQFDLAATRAADGGIPVVVSTDAPVDMPDGPEVLVHTAEAVDLQRAPLPIIVTHAHGQINVGIVDGLHFAGGQMRGQARFGVRPEAAGYRADVEAGILRSVSVGYRRKHGRIAKDGTLVTTRWMPTHAAIVAEPADPAAGFYRQAAAEAATPFVPERELTEPAAAQAPVCQPAALPATPKGATMADQEAAAGVADHTRATAHVSQPQGTPGNAALLLVRGRRRGI